MEMLKKVKHLISQNALEKAIGALKTNLQSTDKNYNELIQIEARLNDWDRKQRIGIVESQVEINAIRNSLLSLVDSVFVQATQKSSPAPLSSPIDAIKNFLPSISNEGARLIFEIIQVKTPWRKQSSLATKTGLTPERMDEIVLNNNSYLERGTNRHGQVLYKIRDAYRQEVWELVARG